MSTQIKVKTGSYNQRRYGKPWIARVDFSATPKGDFQWGDWVGDHRNGSDGLLLIAADDGDIVAIGQKDFRNSKNSAPEWYQVRDGKLHSLTGKAEAYKLATTTPQEA